jgi:replication-associated recombination protein RarA
MAFNHRYDPKSLDDLVIDSNNKRILELFVTKELTDHLLLEGSNGTGKTTVTKLLPVLTCGQNQQVEDVKGSEDFVIDEYVLYGWDNFIGLCRVQGLAPYIVIDEIDKIKKNLPLFWQWLDTRRGQVTVIGTTNQLVAIPRPMRSRMRCLTLMPVRAVEMLPRAEDIFREEGLRASKPFLLQELSLVESSADIRKYMERLELVAIALRAGVVRPHVNATASKPAPFKRVK